MRRIWSAMGVATVIVGLAGLGSAEPTKYCAARIEEAEDTVKEIERGKARIKNAGDLAEIEAWVTQAKRHIATAKAAAQEEDCVLQVELAKTLTQDALFLAAQN